MKYDSVYIDAIGYELAPVVVTSAELEHRLDSVYQSLRIPAGQLEQWTGIVERRWWEPEPSLSACAAAAARQALASSSVPANEVGLLIYAGVCREAFEPATACAVAEELQIAEDAAVYDISNACLGVLNGMIEAANRIQLGQIRSALVVSCESAREINEQTIRQLCADADMDRFRLSLATLTGGSGAVAVLLSDGSYGQRRRRLLGGVQKTAPRYHRLCRWGWESTATSTWHPFMRTDSVSVLKHGVELGQKTWRGFRDLLAAIGAEIDKTICHQVGSGHRDAILGSLGLSADRDFTSYEYLGNIGTVSLPLTAALAEQRGFLRGGDRVGWLGIGSGLNCLMLGIEW